ncbi:hypothetical protein [Aerobium aerolatum]|uniref:Uncharacterized protein n=1 Tax=Aquamicrobium aerolatum DSM 21857 TaxID=1121003 RepID=A0A1I3SXF3_9HYPH|nr:hypothetical protein [Aquamicrobium aerolatum]SFJ62902.1 hypothetical protein SAMN03080618_03491 [Aquamicrobium aerolatum DSM 21857]
MTALLFSRAGAALAGVVVVLGLLTFSYVKAYQAGAAAERMATLNLSVEVLRERNATDDQIRNLDDAGLCAALGGLFADGTCQ